MRARFTFRIRLIAVFLVLVTVVFAIRLYSVQIMHGSEFRDRAEGQYVYTSADTLSRGDIFFAKNRNLSTSLASLDYGYTIALVPREIIDVSKTYDTLSQYIELDPQEFLETAGKIDDPYEEIAERVPSDIGVNIRAEEIPGVRVVRERWRSYPGEETAAHVVGFMGFGDDGTREGQYGLERFYDDALTKTDAGLYINFFADIFGNLKDRVRSGSEQKPGANILTALDPVTQSYMEGLLDDYVARWGPETVGAIVMDPHTGEIVAMSARPTFNPNDVSDADPRAFSNPLVERVYEFGSIMKPLTVAAGIDAGVITADTTYNDQGTAVYDGSRISNFDGKARGVVPMQEVLSQSLNTGVAFIVEKLGTSVFREYIDAYGIREETGIDLPNEATPLVSNLESPRMIEYVTASFGQGFAITPVAMARALATLANGGLVPAPHVATELQYPGGVSKKVGWSPERRALSKESTETVTRMLVEVVDTALRDGSVKIPELSVAAKTGTAQIARTSERGYYDDRYLHSFFGYFPAYEPEYIVFFFAVAPQGAQYASETWTEPFIDTVHFLVNYHDITPDRVSTN